MAVFASGCLLFTACGDDSGNGASVTAADDQTEDSDSGDDADNVGDDNSADDSADPGATGEAFANGTETSFEGELSADAPAVVHDIELAQGQVIRWAVGTQGEFDSIAAIAVNPEEFRSGSEEYLPFWTDAFSDAADPKLEVVIRDLPPDLRDLAEDELPATAEETLDLLDMDVLLNGDEWVEEIPGVTELLGDRVIVQGGSTGRHTFDEAADGYRPCFIAPADGTYSVIVAAEEATAYGPYIALVEAAPVTLAVEDLDVQGYLDRNGTDPCFESFN